MGGPSFSEPAVMGICDISAHISLSLSLFLLSLPRRIILSTPLAVVCYFLIWYVPPFEDGKVIWYLVFYCLFQTLQTVSGPFLRILSVKKMLFCTCVACVEGKHIVACFPSNLTCQLL